MVIAVCTDLTILVSYFNLTEAPIKKFCCDRCSINGQNGTDNEILYLLTLTIFNNCLPYLALM